MVRRFIVPKVGSGATLADPIRPKYLWEKIVDGLSYSTEADTATDYVMQVLEAERWTAFLDDMASRLDVEELL